MRRVFFYASAAYRINDRRATPPQFVQPLFFERADPLKIFSSHHSRPFALYLFLSCSGNLDRQSRGDVVNF